MTADENVRIMLEIFKAIEQRDEKRILHLVHPDVKFHWPPSLPYGGIVRGLKVDQPSWGKIWTPLQPTEAERRLDPRVVAASEEEVVILWRQRGASPTGERIDTPVLGLYKLHEGKMVRAQMFYFDTAGVLKFLEKASGEAA